MFTPWSLAIAPLPATARLSGQASAQPSAVTGVVQDQTGAVLAGTTVELAGVSSGAASVVQSTTADGAGTFCFEKVVPGRYELRAKYEGFNPASARVRVGARSPGPQKLVLAIASRSQEITVSNAAAQVDANASSNVDAVTVDQTCSRACRSSTTTTWRPFPVLSILDRSATAASPSASTVWK